MLHVSPSLLLAVLGSSGLWAVAASAEPASPSAETTSAVPAQAEPAAASAPAEPAPAAPPNDAARPPLAPTPLGRPAIDVRVPEPPPPPERRAHRHDGFYLRTDVGLVTAHTYVTSDRVTHPSYSVSGGGLALDVLAGGTPSTGLSLGGALSLQRFAHGSGSSAGLGLLGVYVDGFPDASGGLHLGGMLGLAGSRTQRPNNRDELRGGGLGMSAWIGHDWWVADEWSLGGLLRLSGALTSDRSHRDEPDPYKLESSSYELAFLFSVLYH